MQEISSWRKVESMAKGLGLAAAGRRFPKGMRMPFEKREAFASRSEEPVSG
jgi:hypothetical protein